MLERPLSQYWTSPLSLVIAHTYVPKHLALHNMEISIGSLFLTLNDWAILEAGKTGGGGGGGGMMCPPPPDLGHR